MFNVWLQETYQIATLQGGAPKIANLVYNSNFTMVHGTYNYSIHGVYKPSNITGGAHIARGLNYVILSSVGGSSLKKVPKKMVGLEPWTEIMDEH